MEQEGGMGNGDSAQIRMSKGTGEPVGTGTRTPWNRSGRDQYYNIVIKVGGESAEHEKFVSADVAETMHGYRRSLHRSPSSVSHFDIDFSIESFLLPIKPNLHLPSIFFQIISEDLSDPVHSHKDLDKDAALYFRKVVQF